MATGTFSLEEAYGTQSVKPIQFAKGKPSGVTDQGEEDGPEKILARIEAESGHVFSKADRAVALEDIRNGATFDIAVPSKGVMPSEPVASEDTGEGTFSLDDAYGAEVAKPMPKPAEVVPGEDKTGTGFTRLVDKINQTFGAPTLNMLEGIGNTLERRYKEEFQGQEKMGSKPFKDEELEWRQRIAANPESAADLPKYMEHLKPEADVAGFIKNLDNPIKLMTSDSLPANFVSYYANLPAVMRKKFDAARQVMMQENIVSNPDKFPAVSVAAAKAEVEKRRAKQDPNVRQLWDQLKEAAAEDPGRFGAQLTNSLIADPELLFAPVGLGTRVLGRTAEIAKGTQVTNRAVRLADQIIDSGSLAAATNLAITAQDKMARGTELTLGELKMAGAMGAVIGGPLGAIFSRGARAKLLDLDAAKLNNTYEDILRERAMYDVEVENAISHPDSIDPAARARIDQMLGITSKTDRAKMLADRRRDAKATYKNETELSDYNAAKAEYRMQRVAEQQEAQAKLATEDAQRQVAAQPADVRIVSPDAPDGVAGSAVIEALAKPGHLRTAEDLIAIRSMRGQSGKIDGELAVRLGLVGAGGTAGALMAPEDQRIAGTFLGALGGFLLPGVGSKSVMSRFRQSGAIDADGLITSQLVRQGKMLADKDIPAANAEDIAKMRKAVAGDQQAFRSLYDDHQPRLVRYAQRFLREAGPKLGIDAEEVVNDAFMKAIKNFDNFRDEASFSTYMHSIVKNEGLMAIREAKGLPSTSSIYNPTPGDAPGSLGAGHILEGDTSAIKGSVEGAAADIDTPENIAIRDEVNTQIVNAIGKLSKRDQQIVIKSELELMPLQEIADELGMPLGSVKSIVSRAKAEIAESIAKGYGAKPPRSQRGSIDDRLLKVGALAALGAGAGGYVAYLNDKNHVLGMGLGAVAMLALASKGKTGTSVAGQIVQGADYATGLISTRVMNKSKELWMRMLNHERVVLRDTHKNLKAVDPFLVRLNKLKPEVQNVITRAILTGDPSVTDRLLNAIGDADLIKDWKAVRATLDSLGDQLVHLKRFKKKSVDYFPRIVKDVPGLIRALGREQGTFMEETLRAADMEAITARGTGLSDLERSLIINKILKSDEFHASQPGYAKKRVVESITPELQEFYATPTESLHSYIRSAVEDIERARFFGEDLEVVKNKDTGNEYTNNDLSAGKLVERLVREKKLNAEDQAEITSMMKSRFIGGERAPHELWQHIRNLNTAGLLGNFKSAATQMGDVIMQTFVQDLRSTLESVARQVGGKKLVSMKDFGLADHIAEEFVSTTRTAKLVQFAFKWSLFRGIDTFGKNTALNAAVIRAGRLAKSERGVQVLARRYEEALGPVEFKQWIKDLQKGDKTDLVNQMAFAELSRSQPISRIELPQAYLDNPNGRMLYQFKSFMLKQLDLARREGYNEIKAGNYARGFKNLTMIGLTLGISGTATSAVKDFLSGKPIDIKSSDVVMNALKTFGLSQWVLDQGFGVSKDEAKERRQAGDKMARTRKAEPIKALGGMATPPYKIFEEMATADPKLWNRIPVVGPILYDHILSEEQKK